MSLGGRLHVEEHAGRPPATVWLHHGTGSTHSWDTHLPAAAGGRRALVYDRRGFGASPRARAFTPAMFDEDAADLVDLLDADGGGGRHLVGHSDGGSVALLAAARRPDLVLSVAVIATHVCGDPGTIEILRGFGPPSSWDRPVKRVLERDHGPRWEEVAGGWYRLWTSPEWESWSIVDALGAVRCLVLVVHDRRDALSPPFHADEILRRVPRARVLWLDTGNHDPHRRERALFVAALHTLWQEAEAPTSSPV